MSTRRYLLVMGVLTLVMMMTGTSILLSQRAQARLQPIEEAIALPVLGHISDFELIDSTGQAFSMGQLAGKISVVDFIFTSCAGICPVMTGAMAELQRDFGGDERLHFVSITVDPKTDTPEVLSAYGARYEANLATWHFLTGDAEDIHSIATRNFKIGSLDDVQIHSARFVLVDSTGAIRGYYVGTEPDAVSELAIAIADLLSVGSENTPSAI